MNEFPRKNTQQMSLIAEEAPLSSIITPAFTSKTLAEEVEKLVKNDHLEYIEAIITICDRTGIDPSDMGKLVTGSLRAKVEAEATRSNRLPRINSLYEEDEEQ